MLNKTGKYAVRAVLYLARNTKPNERCGVKELAEELDVPRHFLAKILQQLSRANLVSTVKGPKGGVYLSKSNREKNLYEILDCLGGTEAFRSCLLGLRDCSDINPCPLHVHAKAYKEGLLYIFENLTIEEIATRIRKKDLVI